MYGSLRDHVNIVNYTFLPIHWCFCVLIPCTLSRRCFFFLNPGPLLTDLPMAASLPHGIKLRKKICKVINDSTVASKWYSCPCVHGKAHGESEV